MNTMATTGISPFRQYRAAKNEMDRAHTSMHTARLQFGKAKQWWQQMRLLAAKSLPCPFCKAEAGTTCVWTLIDRPAHDPLHPSRYELLDEMPL